MILHSFRVTEFRSIKDSGWIDVEQITALIGTNESGKTNILLPLWKLNPADDSKIDLIADLPRDKYHLYRDLEKKPTFIDAKYVLVEQERRDLAELSGHNEDEFAEIIVSKDFDGKLYLDFPLEKDDSPNFKELATVELQEYKSKLLSTSNATGEELIESQEKAIEILNTALTKLDSNDDIKAILTDLVADIESFKEDVNCSIDCLDVDSLLQSVSCLIEKQKPAIIKIQKAVDYILNNMPRYVYYSNYGNLDSQIYLPNVISDNNSNRKLNEKEAAKARTLNTLFKYIKLDPDEICNLGAERLDQNNSEDIERISKQKEEREILLSSASASFTKSFNEWWKQGNYTFIFQADGGVFTIWVCDSVRLEKIKLEYRSSGLQWFFSFYLVFLVESEMHHQNAILLLDEPGVTLHPLAQKDLFHFFENLAKSNQILYTTHSPFMVDSNHLERVRSVYIGTDGKTCVSSDLRASEKQNGKNQTQSIYPAHAALGLTVSDTLLINCNPVLVEGASDQIYLSALKNLLISKQSISPLKEIVFIPTGGIKGIKVTSAIVSETNSSKPPVLLDGDKPGIKMANDLKSDFYANETDKIINISDYTSLNNGEIEDIFPKEKLARIVTSFLPRTEYVEEDFDEFMVNNKPLCDQIEEYVKKYNINLEKGWKVKLATKVKNIIIKNSDKVISKDDSEYVSIVKLFTQFVE